MDLRARGHQDCIEDPEVNLAADSEFDLLFRRANTTYAIVCAAKLASAAQRQPGVFERARSVRPRATLAQGRGRPAAVAAKASSDAIGRPKMSREVAALGKPKLFSRRDLPSEK
jgi:hypothetical protein